MSEQRESEIKVTTNHHVREILDGWNLSAAERGEFHYIDWPSIDAGNDSASFVRYRGDLIDLGDLDGRCTGELATMGWDLYRADTYFSGLVFRYVELDYAEHGVVVGRFTTT